MLKRYPISYCLFDQKSDVIYMGSHLSSILFIRFDFIRRFFSFHTPYYLSAFVCDLTMLSIH